MASDLTRFATALADHLGWTAAPAQPDGHPLRPSDTALRDALGKATEAALLTAPGGAEFIIAPRTDPDSRRYLVGPLHPTDLPDNAGAALAERGSAAVLLNAAATPDYAAQRFMLFHSTWDRNLTSVRAALEPGAAARIDNSFTTYAETVAAALPGDWIFTRLDLGSPSDRRLLHSLWSAGPEPGRRAAASAARATLLSGPRHRVLLVQDAGPYQGIAAATLVPPRLRITPDSLMPGPPLVGLPSADAAKAAETIQNDLLPSWDRAVFSVKVGALAHATVELRQALDSWDAVSDTYHAFPMQESGAVLRDARAWDAVQTYLTHAPAVLKTIATVTTGADLLAGPIRDDLRTLEHLREDLRDATRIKRHWSDLIRRAPSEERSLLVEERNADMWHHATVLSERGDAVVRTARHVTYRIGTPPAPPAKTPAPAPATARTPAPVLITGPVRRSR